MTKAYRLLHSRRPARARARVRLSLCVLFMGAILELMTSASSAATSPAAPVEITTAASDFFYHTDDLYNVMAITDDTGAVADNGNERYEYADYGQPVDIFTIDKINGTPSAIANPYNFTGRRYDPEIGWYYYRTRYLDPVAGRFTTRDTIGIWGDLLNIGNAYPYVANSPWTIVDPQGKACKCIGCKGRSRGIRGSVPGRCDGIGGVNTLAARAAALADALKDALDKASKKCGTGCECRGSATKATRRSIAGNRGWNCRTFGGGRRGLRCSCMSNFRYEVSGTCIGPGG